VKSASTSSCWRAVGSGFAVAAACLPAALPVSAATAAADADAEQEMPAVQVKASAARPPEGVTMAPAQARTTVTEATLRQRQPDSVFQVMDEVPGVTVQGGPRNSGMGFNIRGYSDNEDVRIELDGVVKGFEKYRFGGTFIEPELLKSIEVRRGAQVESAGALGGTVSATTRDARDMLRTGQQWGARARIGHATNNDERQAMVAVYGRPTEATDTVLAFTRRAGGNLKLAGGDTLPLSEVDMGSGLAKASWWVNDAWRLSASWIRYRDQGLQAYDTFSGTMGTGTTPMAQVGTFGQVQRRIDDDTVSLQALWTDEAAGHEWQTTLGRSRTRVQDHFEPGWSVFSLSTQVDDDVHQTHLTLDSRLRWQLLGRPSNSSSVASSGTLTQQLALRAGLQAGHSDRAAERVTGNAALNQALYRDGYNPAQPPGTRDTQGTFLQLDWRLGRMQVLPGVRWDQIASTVHGANADLLKAAGESDTVRYTEVSPSLTLSYALVPERWTVFATTAQSFRPPLLDEAFMRAGYGVCNNNALLRMGTGTTPRVPGYAPGAQVAPSTGICSNAFVPETSEGFEAGVHTRQIDLFGPRSTAQAKLTFFFNRTEHLLESLMAEPGGSGRLIQPGWERRRGIELETSVGWAQWRTRLAASRLRGRQFDGLFESDLVGVPGDRVHLSFGRQHPWGEWGLRWQQVWARRYYVDTARTQVAEAPGYRLLGASLTWRLNPTWETTLTADNLADASYRLDNGLSGALGTAGPGRNVRISLSARY
jgi:hemoglobin/transferrin/lactoferrin receptor protein